VNVPKKLHEYYHASFAIPKSTITHAKVGNWTTAVNTTTATRQHQQRQHEKSNDQGTRNASSEAPSTNAAVKISVAGQGAAAGAGAGDANQGKASEMTDASVVVVNNSRKDDENPDLVIWTKEPLNTIDLESIIVTRREKDQYFVERINVEFRVYCDPQKQIRSNDTLHNDTRQQCPEPMTSSNCNLLEIEYDRNKDASLFIHQNRDVQIDPFIKNFKKRIVDVSYWSDSCQTHISANYTSKVIHEEACGLGSVCPKQCPRHNIYPDKWDRMDRSCKSSDPATMPPLRNHGGPCSCKSTCYTPQATEPNSTWPWKDEAELRFYHPKSDDQTGKTEYKLILANGRLERKEQTYDVRYDCPKNASIDQQSPIDLPPAIHADFSHHLYFIPQGKLIFCGIPKVGISEWLKFFRFSWGARDYLSIPYYKRDQGSFSMRSLEPIKAKAMLSDPSWTKAVFFREPSERLLSAYLDKVADRYGQLYGKDRIDLTFPEFVDGVANNFKNMDPHWKPQVTTCGLDYLLPHFDFIGSMEHISEHTKLLLEKVGMWDDYGSKFDDGHDLPKVGSACFVAPPDRSASNTTVNGFNQRGTTSKHATGSKSKFEKYYTPELLEKVRKVYAIDYAIWDDLKRRPTDQVASGQNLESVKNYCSNR
jgi:hypothetical protein